MADKNDESVYTFTLFDGSKTTLGFEVNYIYNFKVHIIKIIIILIFQVNNEIEAETVIEELFTTGLSIDILPIQANFEGGNHYVQKLIADEIKNTKVTYCILYCLHIFRPLTNN